MKRSLFLLLAVIGFAFVLTPDAQAEQCSYCTHDSPTNQRCVQIEGDPAGDYAEYGACWEEPVLDPCGDEIGDRCAGTPPGPECNTWQSGGGGGGGYDPFNPFLGDGGGDPCSGGWDCPAECSSCN